MYIKMSTVPEKEKKQEEKKKEQEDEGEAPPQGTWAYDLYHGWWL